MADSIPLTGPIDLTSASKPRPLPVEVLHAWITTVDHKKIGLMYIGYALVFLVIAGLEAIVIRAQLAVPQNGLVSPQVFNRLFTMHGTTMVFFVGMPILFGFGNYLIPLMIGARDMALGAALLDFRLRHYVSTG
jgi:cytochrome c oxidase subunit 1